MSEPSCLGEARIITLQKGKDNIKSLAGKQKPLWEESESSEGLSGTRTNTLALVRYLKHVSPGNIKLHYLKDADSCSSEGLKNTV